ncbi:MAG TPA: hypothetical protein DCG69_00335 [Bacteroidales bacterium]|nr:hypothetical protein [Bacteroidales bacterium]
MSFIKKYPISFSLLLIASIIVLNRIPLSNNIRHYGLDEFSSDTIEKIVFNFFVVLGSIFLVSKNKIPISYFDRNISFNAFYYLPLILYIIIFSGGFSDFRDFKFSEIPYLRISLYSLKTFSSAFLEEILFRGVILGLLLYKLNKDKYGVFKSVFISALLFGSIHIINLLTISATTFQSVFNQVYAASCLGVLYGAVYLKTRSILVLSILHFLSNFFAMIGVLEISTVIETVRITEKSFFENISTEIVRLIIFGIPLLVGLIIIAYIDKKEVDILMHDRAK